MTTLGLTHPEESSDALALWPLQCRVRALRDGWEFAFRAGHYVLGWTHLNSRGETLVEYIQAHMEAGTNPDLYDKAWAFYVWLRLQDRVRFRIA